MIVIQTSKGFKKDFQKLGRKQKDQFYKRVSLFSLNKNDRALNNHALKGVHEGKRSINITGDIRVIYEEINQNTVLFLMIGTHSELYG